MQESTDSGHRPLTGPLGNKIEKEGYERNKVILNRVQK